MRGVVHQRQDQRFPPGLRHGVATAQQERDGPGGDFKTSNVRGRQVFLGVEGKLNSYFAYKVEGGAVNGGAWGWDDAVIEYKPSEPVSIPVTSRRSLTRASRISPD